MASTSGGNVLSKTNNGTRLNCSQTQLDFFSKLTKLADQVIAGTHPVIKLSSPARTKLAQAESRNRTFPVYIGETDLQQSLNSNQTYSTNGQTPSTKSSTIDPIFLTKSDELLRAETVLARRRLEKELQVQVDKKRAHGRDRDLVLEVPQQFDPQNVLNQAIELVKTVSGLITVTDTQNAISASFDENSYYSSQANSWSSEDEEYRTKATPWKPVLNRAELNQSDTYNLRIAQQDRGDDAVIKNLEDDSEVSNTQEPTMAPAGKDIEEFRDESYSPPAADAFNTFPAQGSLQRVEVGRARQNGLNQASPKNSMIQSDSLQVQPLVSPVSPAFPVVTNHIPVPYAPRPARVSPLAVARIRDRAEQTSGSRPASRIQERYSPRAQPKPKNQHSITRRTLDRGVNQEPPAARAQTINNPRKRRREQDLSDTTRRQSGKRVARSPAHSPAPYIKPEPISPPPFSNEPPRRLILRNDGQADIEVMSSVPQQHSPYVREYGQQDELSSYDVPTVYDDPRDLHSNRPYEYYSQTEFGYDSHVPIRDEAAHLLSTSPPPRRFRDYDLRRVATYQSALRPQSAVPTRHAGSPTELQAVRGYQQRQNFAPRPLEIAPMRSAARTKSAIPQARYPQTEIATMLSYEPHLRLHEAPSRVFMDRSMPPPPPPAARRIVVDQYGNEYVAVPTSSRTGYSMGPEDRYARRSVSYQPPPLPREQYMPMPMPVAEPYEYAQL